MPTTAPVTRSFTPPQRAAARLAPVVAGACLAAALAGPVSAEPGYTCQQILPPTQVCVDVGEPPQQECFYQYKTCYFDYDGEPGFERPALFFERRGAASDPPFISDKDRHCYQGQNFDPGATEPDASEYGYHRFALLLPEGNSGGPFPVFASIRGGARAGWSQPPIQRTTTRGDSTWSTPRTPAPGSGSKANTAAP